MSTSDSLIPNQAPVKKVHYQWKVANLKMLNVSAVICQVCWEFCSRHERQNFDYTSAGLVFKKLISVFSIISDCTHFCPSPRLLYTSSKKCLQQLVMIRANRIPPTLITTPTSQWGSKLSSPTHWTLWTFHCLRTQSQSSKQHNRCGLSEKRNWPVGMLVQVLYRRHPLVSGGSHSRSY